MSESSGRGGDHRAVSNAMLERLRRHWHFCRELRASGRSSVEVRDAVRHGMRLIARLRSRDLGESEIDEFSIIWHEFEHILEELQQIENLPPWERGRSARNFFAHRTMTTPPPSSPAWHSLREHGELQERDEIDISLSIREGSNISTLEPALAFISGPGPSNLVMSFFLSNPTMEFSREDVFAHLNRHCEELGLGEFFTKFFKYEFTTKNVENALERESLKIGRSSILRTISNLEKTGVLRKVGESAFRTIDEGQTRSKYGLAGSGKTGRLLNLFNNVLGGREYREFEIFATERKEKMEAFHDVGSGPESFQNLVEKYIDDVVLKWDEEKRQLFRTKLARLSYYCESNGRSYSSLNREWTKYVNSQTHDNYTKKHLVDACRKLGSDKTKKKLNTHTSKKLFEILLELIQEHRDL